ncbi:agmatine deiminase [Butyrivibrio sp. AE2032]|uniref:agmatine deiminase n=1 Tax=Butyrivibrio sp. AE2032 TaxID=1458463 RepID=UPI00054F54A9|nr:agmatine deiminase [Butyrivibrio sp. AE2032]
MNNITDNTPRQDGYFMPAEFSKHDGTIMIYPTRPGSWGKDRTEALEAFGKIFLEILRRENLYLLADREHWEEARKFVDGIIEDYIDARGYSKEQHVVAKDGDEIQGLEDLDQEGFEDRCLVLPIDSDDAWARDVGPTFLIQDGQDIRAVNWSFNAWGGEVDGLYASWDKDDKVAKAFCDMCEIDYYDAAPFVLEGGSIHCDGEGTVMVTESCLLSMGRNPELTREQIEENLKEYLGVEKVLWLPYGIYNDETNEHVDNVCAFIKPGEVVLAWTDNKEDPQYEMSLKDLEYLESVTDAKGRKLKVHRLNIPKYPVLVNEEDLKNFEFEEGEDVREVGERLAASYVNCYFINGAVLVPQFGGKNEDSDKAALDTLKALLPDREIIGIDARAILLGGGNIHCITQQVPEN